MHCEDMRNETLMLNLHGSFMRKFCALCVIVKTETVDLSYKEDVLTPCQTT